MTVERAGPEVRAKQILVIDDTADVRGLFVDLIRDAGHEAIPVALAADALPILRRLTPDLIVLDVVMPRNEMTGIDLLFRLRRRAEWTDIPVLIVSSIGELIDPEIARGLHVHAVLTKPVSVPLLLEKVRQVVGP
jgi:CheY-like chemotaxis protein